MNRAITGLLIGLAAAVLMLLATLADPGLFGTEWLFYDAMSRHIARRLQPDPGIIIVSLNEKSIRSLAPFYGRPPYSREVMALITDEVRSGGGRVIVFDFLFLEENINDPDGDRRFAEALDQIPSVLASDTQPGGLTPPHPFRSTLWQITGLKPSPHRLATPLPMFTTADAIGTIRLAVKEREANTREYLIADSVEGSLYVPSLAMAAAAMNSKLGRSGRFDPGTFTLGDLTIPVTRKHTFLIRWNGAKAKDNPTNLSYPSVDFDHVVLAALSRDDPDSQYSTEELDSFARQRFEGKIALVAMTATGAATDLRATPLSPATAGVEIHANALDNLLNRNFNREAPRWLIALLTVAVTMAAGAVIHPIRSPLMASVVALLFLAGWLASGFFAMDAGWVVYPVGPAIAILLTSIASTTINVVMEQRQSQLLRGTFGHYVSPQVLDYLLSDPTRVQLGGERRELTVLFSDIRGFTSISETAQPEEVVEMLNEYLSRMVDILLKHGGTLDKFIGDAVMGFWNAPTPDANHARKAVECAIDMVAETARLREKWEAEGKAALRIGIGINTGEAVVGNIGSRQVFGYTVIGDAVNLASRLEGTNKEFGTEIIISETTLQQAGGGIITAPLGEVRVKGKANAVRIFEVKGRSG